MTTDERTETGIPGLDEALHGGVITNHSYLIVGAAGTGKTIASIQWLLHGSRNGKKGLYITLAEPVENLARNVKGFGWSLDGIDIVDLNPVQGEPGEMIEEYSVFPPADVEQASMWARIYEEVRTRRPDHVVIDSVTQLRYLSVDDYQFRKQILGLVSFLHRSGCTSFLTFEPAELDREVSVALAVDGILRLRMEISPRRIIGLRSIQVEKLRGSNFMSGFHPLRFLKDGLHVFPHAIEEPGATRPGREKLSSGLEGLDDLLGGGLESGTTTIISGPCGAGKSTLGLQLLVQAIRGGQRAVMYAFEESPEAVAVRGESLGMPVERMLKEGMLQIVRINPMEVYPDEFLHMMRGAVERDGCRTVLIDSLRGYYLAMEEFGSPVANIHNMATYLNRQGVTTLMTNEVERITGDLMATELGVSHVADNILLLRYAEYRGRVIKVIACLKKRYSSFDPAIRELCITDRGIEVARTLTDLHGILTGVPYTAPGSEIGNRG